MSPDTMKSPKHLEHTMKLVKRQKSPHEEQAPIQNVKESNQIEGEENPSKNV